MNAKAANPFRLHPNKCATRLIKTPSHEITDWDVTKSAAHAALREWLLLLLWPPGGSVIQSRRHKSRRLSQLP